MFAHSTIIVYLQDPETLMKLKTFIKILTVIQLMTEIMHDAHLGYIMARNFLSRKRQKVPLSFVYLTLKSPTRFRDYYAKIRSFSTWPPPLSLFSTLAPETVHCSKTPRYSK